LKVIGDAGGDILMLVVVPHETNDSLIRGGKVDVSEQSGEFVLCFVLKLRECGISADAGMQPL
jgi:hypothetical protein